MLMKRLVKRLLGRVLSPRAVTFLEHCWFRLRQFPGSIALRGTLRRVIDAHPDRRGILVVLPGLDWHAPLFQRPQQLARAFARQGYLVFYCTPNREDRARGIVSAEPNLYLSENAVVMRQVRDPLVLAYWATMRDKLFIFRRPLQLIYDYIDDLSVFPLPRPRLLADHQWMLRHASVVSATADRLLAQVREVHPDAILCPNAADHGLFHRVPAPPAPADLQPLLDKPIVGYYGALAEWFDYELLRAAAAACPELNFVLIGVDYDQSRHQYDWSALPNVHFLGPRPYPELPAYAAHFAVATIPFLVNLISLSTSPVKLFEYLAAGRPVVTTGLPECRKCRSVYVAEDADDFVRGIRRALAGEYDPALVDAEARANDWSQRVRQMLAALGETLADAPEPAASPPR
jgi:glycosyltransferase involved in cell wall biosynthesis